MTKIEKISITVPLHNKIIYDWSTYPQNRDSIKLSFTKIKIKTCKLHFSPWCKTRFNDFTKFANDDYNYVMHKNYYIKDTDGKNFIF